MLIIRKMKVPSTLFKGDAVIWGEQGSERFTELLQTNECNDKITKQM